MNIQQLEKSQKMYLEIKSLDAEIIEIEKVAMLIADGNSEVKLSLNVKDTTPKKQESDKVNFDEDGSLKGIQDVQRGYLDWGKMLHQSILDGISTKGMGQLCSTDKVLKSNLSENLSLNVLAILLYDKQEKRKKLINGLKRIGVKL